jgi:hypothetical protein
MQAGVRPNATARAAQLVDDDVADGEKNDDEGKRNAKDVTNHAFLAGGAGVGGGFFDAVVHGQPNASCKKPVPNARLAEQVRRRPGYDRAEPV